MKKMMILMMILLSSLVLTACVDEFKQSDDDYMVTFELLDGEILFTKEVAKGTTVEEPSSEDFLGYEFYGWYSDSSLNVPYDFSQAVVGNITLYAKLKVKSYNVNFEMNGGQVISPLELEMGDVIIPKATPVYQGHEFIGYYYDEELTIEFEFEEMPGEDITLYAKWEELPKNLTIVFSPFRPGDEILNDLSPLADYVKDFLNEYNYNVNQVDLVVGASYESVMEMVGTGIADIGYTTSTTFSLYMDAYDIVPLVASARTRLNKNAMDAYDWNDGLPTYVVDDVVPYYNTLILAGTSPAARALADKVNSRTELVWDDVKDLNWCVRSETSSSGYVYPNFWLFDNFGMTFDDVGNNVIVTSGYGATMAELANGNCDVGTVYGDARMNYEEQWTTDFGRTESIWAETDVIAVGKVMNDLFVVNNTTVDQELQDLLQEAFISFLQTTEGQEAFSFISVQSFVEITRQDYDYTKLVSDFMFGN